MRRTIAGTIALFVTTISYGACLSGACIDANVDRLFVHGTSVLYIGTDGDETQLNCVPYGGVYLTLNPNDANFAPIYSALLTAQIADKLVTIRVFEGSSPCRVMYIILDDQ